MQFLLIAHDGTDNESLARRTATRTAHIELGNKMRDLGTLLYAVAILDDHSNMVGSVCVLDFPSRIELDQWLKLEPYVTGNVWQKIEITSCRVGPSFEGQRDIK